MALPPHTTKKGVLWKEGAPQHFIDPDFRRKFEKDNPLVKLPAEVGLQAITPAPKVDGRTKAVRRRPLKPNHRPKYVITKSQLKAERPHLYL